MKNSFRRLLLASTAATIIGYAGTAAAQSAVDVANGTVTIAAALQAFNVANSQLADGATVDATVATVGTLTGSVTETAAVTVDQTLLANTVSALSRLNQTTNVIQVASPLPTGANTGAVVATTTTVSTNAGVSLLNMQNALNTAAASANITSAPMSLTVAAAGLTGNASIAASQIVADVLVNDGVNSLSATGVGGGNLAVPAALASVQTATGAVFDATATIAGASTGMAIELSGLTGALTGNAVVENNAIAARAGVNTAENELVAGSASAPANGLGLAITLNPAAATVAGVASFVADYAVANTQVTDSAGAVATIAAANLTIDLPAAQDVVGGVASVSGNNVLAAGSVNAATNRAIVNTSGLNGASVAVGSAQSLTSVGNVFNAEVTAATLTIAGGQFDSGSDALIQGNTVAARITGNEATNVLGLTSAGSLANGQAAIVGFQENVDATATATVGTALLDATVNAAASAGRALQVTGNTVEAAGVLNRQTNLMVVSGGPGFGAGAQAASQLVSSQQVLTGGSVTATVTSATMSATSASGPTASVLAANNSIRASAMGNVSSNTISNTARSFSLSR